jgi:hypothetical protein
MTLIYSFDLDSTLAETTHRRDLILGDRSKMVDQDWIDYALACKDDSDGPAAPFLNAIIAQQGGIDGVPSARTFKPIDFIVVSRRDNAAKDLTIEWLNARGWAPKALIMLKDEFKGSDARLQPQWKANAIRAYERTSGDQVVLHLDDFHAVTQHLLSVGIPAMTVRGDEEGEYAFGHAKEIAAS